MLADARWAEEAGLRLGVDPADPRRFDALTAAALIGARPSRIEIGTAVVPVQPRHPIALAQQALSAQAVCGGRLPLGLGVSHHWVIDEMLGLPYERPVATMRRYLDVLDQALAGPGLGRRRERRRSACQPARHHRRHADAGADRRPRAADAAPRRRAHRRHDPLDGRRAGDRSHIAPRDQPAPPSRPGARRRASSPACRCASAATTRSTWPSPVPTGSCPRPRSRPTTRSCSTTATPAQVGDILAAGSEAAIEKRLRSFADAGATDVSVRVVPDRRRPRRAARVVEAHPRLPASLRSARDRTATCTDVLVRCTTPFRRPTRRPHVARTLDIPVFDADNHLYETKDALTKFLPDRYKGAIDYVEVRGRTKIVVRGQISEYIPNPTFDVVARPGAQEDYFRNGNPEGKSRREIFGEPMRAIPAFREPAPRVELMDEQGIDRALMFPTLASLVEERMRDDPELIHAVIHALNEWMYETWQFDYEDRIFATPVITLPIVEKAIEELEWVVERGARVVLIRPAPVPGYRGPAVVRPARVRPVLGEGRRARRPRRHALVRQRLRALRQRLDGQRQRDAAVPAPGVPDAVGSGGRSRTPCPRWSATARCPGSRSSRSR